MIGGKDEVRCAIVDSGVQRELSGNNIFGGITFKRSEAGIEIIENEYQDENGHGRSDISPNRHRVLYCKSS